jgi:hypothetical protein
LFNVDYVWLGFLWFDSTGGLGGVAP